MMLQEIMLDGLLDEIGSFELLGRCYARCIFDVRFERPSDCQAFLEELPHYHCNVAEADTRRPVRALLKPADFEPGHYGTSATAPYAVSQEAPFRCCVPSLVPCTFPVCGPWAS